jgi:hypothetical protein
MGSLSNLYISQSYQSLLHFSTDNSASATLTQLQDGVGQNLGLFLNTNGDLRTTTSVSSSTIEATNLKIKNKIELTGSIDIDGPVTASSAFIEADLIVSGTLFAKEVHTLIESSSIIFSTGSNILGDSTADTQTLIGTIIVSGSSKFTGSLFVTNDISSSTLNGVGNVTLYSQSVDYRLDNLETYSGSAEQKFVAIQASTSSLNNFTASANNKFSEIGASTASLNNFTASQETKNNTLASYTSSINDKFDAVGISTASLNSFTGSLVQTFVTTASLQATASFLQNQIDQKLFTSSFNSFSASVNSYTQSQDTKNSTLGAYTASVDTKFSTLSSYTQSNDTKWSTLQSYTASIDSKFSTLALTTSSLISKTGSYATTGSNNFVESQTITGSLRSNVTTLSIVGNTASMDCSLGNFFTLNLPSSSTTALTATNIQPGQTIQLRIRQLAITGATTGSLTYPAYIKFPQYGNYNPSPFSGAVDILSFAAFDNTTLYAVNVRNMNY